MKNLPLCSKVSDIVFCPDCKSIHTIKNGFTKTRKQQYCCKSCNKHFIGNYTYRAYEKDINEKIVIFTKEGLGIRSTARVLKISATTLLSRIIFIAKNIKKPLIHYGKTYEVDEMCTFWGNKNQHIWIVYALDRHNKEVVDFNIGARTNQTLQNVISSLEMAKARRIYTDKLRNYFYIISKQIHRTALFQTNHIERKNLTIRTHLKRLSRKTICFSRNFSLLFAVLKIYFWG
jgi:IS1 family transposase/transposase-like protein